MSKRPARSAAPVTEPRKRTWIRATDDEREAWKAKAAEFGMSMSSWMRWTLNRESRAARKAS